MNDMVRVKLENGMEASLPRAHAENSGYTPLKDEAATNSLGNALEPTGADEKLLAKRESQLAAVNKKAATSGQEG